MDSYIIEKVITATKETICMTFFSMIFVFFIGLFFGIVLFLSSQNQNSPLAKVIYTITSSLLNVLRSIPFIILIILLIPFTKMVSGTILGIKAAIPPLVIGLFPFYSKMVEASLNEVNKGVIELWHSLKATRFQLIVYFLIPESLKSLIANLTNTTINMIGFSTICGIIGAGGLGNLAFLEGFQRNNYNVIFITILIILVLIFITQFSGSLLIKLLNRKY